MKLVFFFVLAIIVNNELKIIMYIAYVYMCINIWYSIHAWKRKKKNSIIIFPKCEKTIKIYYYQSGFNIEMYFKSTTARTTDLLAINKTMTLCSHQLSIKQIGDIFQQRWHKNGIARCRVCQVYTYLLHTLLQV